MQADLQLSMVKLHQQWALYTASLSPAGAAGLPTDRERQKRVSDAIHQERTSGRWRSSKNVSTFIDTIQALHDPRTSSESKEEQVQEFLQLDSASDSLPGEQ